MNPFLLFWVLVAANLLNPVPALGGIAVGVVGGTGRVKAAFAAVGATVTVMTALAYMHAPDGQFSDGAYTVGAECVAMTVWAVFVVAVVFTAREMLPRNASSYN